MNIEEEGVKYCPGEELPTYIYTEYKPTFSGKKNTNFSHFTIGLEDKTAPVDKEKDMVTVLDVNTEYLGVHDMVEGWNNKIALEADRGEPMVGVLPARRVSADFRRLLGCFEESGDRGTGGNVEVLENENSEAKPQYFPIFKTFSSINVGSILPGPRNKKQKLCVVRMEKLSLVDFSTNGKRVRADGDIDNVCVNSDKQPGGRSKKLKVSPM